jgi:hypothetical protein
VFGPRRSRIQQAIVGIGNASSGFLQFVAMAFGGDQRSQVVHRHREALPAYAGPTADPKTWLAPRAVRFPFVKPALTDVG